MSHGNARCTHLVLISYDTLERITTPSLVNTITKVHACTKHTCTHLTNTLVRNVHACTHGTKIYGDSRKLTSAVVVGLLLTKCMYALKIDCLH